MSFSEAVNVRVSEVSPVVGSGLIVMTLLLKNRVFDDGVFKLNIVTGYVPIDTS